MKHLTLIAMAFALFATTSHANTTTVYKSKGKHGETVFSQFMPKGTTNYEALQMRSDGRTADAGKMASIPDPATPNSDAQKIAEQQKQIDELKAQEATRQAQDMARHCQNMRSNLANLNTGGRVYKTTDQGQREYLNDQQISAQKQQLTTAIQQHCGS